MAEALQTIVLAAVMFVATNADDLVLLGIFFARPATRPRTVVLGQLAGIGAITAISHAASLLALVMLHAWLPLLGVVPLWIGFRWLQRSPDPSAAPVQLTWWSVAGVTLANGADNFGVYVPAFAMQTGLAKAITAATFAGLTLAWCAIAWQAVKHPRLGPWIRRACNRVAPFVLIGIGLWILAHLPVLGPGLAGARP